MTDALLFSWDELASGSVASDGDAPAISPVIRVVETKSAVRPHSLHESRLPQVISDVFAMYFSVSLFVILVCFVYCLGFGGFGQWR